MMIRLLFTTLLLISIGCITPSYVAAKSAQSSFGPEMEPEMLVSVLRTRGDNSAETNAHRIILSVHTASNFINDVLESAISKTLQSAVTSRENLFFSLQGTGNDSRRIFELVDRATTVVWETAKKAKAEVNDAIKTALDHLRESIKIIIRNLPESKLNEPNLAAIIENGQYRMEVVVENSGQRIIDAMQSYRSHFIKIEKETGHVMVDPESSQEAIDAVKNIINAAKSQIQEAVSGSTSFILARIRDCLSHLGDASDRKTTTSTALTITVGNNDTDTFQAEVISVSQMEDPQEDKIVVVGDVPSAVTEVSSTELPMIINTPAPNTSLVSASPAMSEASAASQNSTTPKAVSWQDDIPKGSVFNHEANQGNFSFTTGFPAGSTNITSTDSSPMSTASTVETPAPASTTVESTTTTVATTPAGPLIRRRIPQIKPIVSGGAF